MIVFTKDIQYNQCKREDILNFKNQNYINSLKHELKTGKGFVNFLPKIEKVLSKVAAD